MTAIRHDDIHFVDQASALATVLGRLVRTSRASFYLAVNSFWIERLCRDAYRIEALKNRDATPEQFAAAAEKLLDLIDDMRPLHRFFMLQHRSVVKGVMWLLRGEAYLRGEDPASIKAPRPFIVAIWDSLPKVFRLAA
ncbi:MAG TPA: hypothetical protein VFA48_05535 [Gammaproteobacteria bacterium]|nr:hypothetical protein [Gammaproteobacteria bacterium]